MKPYVVIDISVTNASDLDIHVHVSLLWFLLTGQTVTTVGEEKQFNPRLSKPKDQFVEIMKNLNLPYPKQIGMLYHKSYVSVLMFLNSSFIKSVTAY